MAYNPGRFNNFYDVMKPMKKKLLEENMVNMTFSENETVLDVGCGPGQLTFDVMFKLLEKHLKFLVAVDIERSMIEWGQRVYNHPLIKYKVLDFSKPITNEVKRKLLSEDGTSNGFDKIISAFCFMLIRDQRLVTRNIYSLLKPGGEVLFMITAKSCLFDMLLGLAKMAKWAKYMQDVEENISPYHFSEDPVQEMREYLEEAGLQVTYCKMEENVVRLKNAEELKNLLGSFNIYLDKIPLEYREEYMNDAMEVINLNDGQNEYILQVLTVLARKPAD